jgi:hypothetical protein
MTRRSLVLALLVAAAALIAGGIWWSELEVRDTSAMPATDGGERAADDARALPSIETLELDDSFRHESERQDAPQPAAIATRGSTAARVTLVADVSKYLDAVVAAELQVVALSHEVQKPPAVTEATNITRGLSAARRYEGAVVGRTDARGRVELDVTELIATPSGWKPHALAIRVERVGAQADEFDLLLSAADRARALVEPLRCAVRLELVCNCTVHASVRTADDDRAQTSIQYLEFVGGAPAEPHPQARLLAAAGLDEIVVSLQCGRDYVAVASSKGYATQSVLFRAAPDLDLGKIVLERGAVLAGRVRVGLEGVRGLVQAELVDEGNGRQFRVENTPYLWREGGPALTRASTSTDDDGAFRIEGLAPERYRLTLRAPQIGLTVPVAIGEPLAPATALELHLNSAPIDLRVTRAGRPLPSLQVDVYQRGPGGNAGSAVITDNEGRARVWVHADHATRVGVVWRETPQSDPIRREEPLDFPGAGVRREVRIDL